MPKSTPAPGDISYRRPVVLEGSRVILRPFIIDDARALLETVDTPEILAHSQTQMRTLTDARAEIDRGAEDPNRVAFAQVRVADGTIVGTTSLYEISPATRSVYVGYTWLSSRAQRTGINTESKFLLLRHCFETLGCVRVGLHIDERNAQSLAAAARLGAVEEGRLRNHRRRRDGSWRTTVTFSIIAEEWPEVGARLRARLEEPRLG